MRIDLENYLLTTKETLSEKMISDYLKDLFKEEIEEERKILVEGGEVPVEKTISIEPIAEIKAQEPEKIFIEKRDLEKREPLEKKGIPQSIKEAFRAGDVRMKVGIILVLCILGGIVSFYLLIDKPSTNHFAG